jgi:hypothetical protein
MRSRERLNGTRLRSRGAAVGDLGTTELCDPEHDRETYKITHAPSGVAARYADEQRGRHTLYPMPTIHVAHVGMSGERVYRVGVADVSLRKKTRRAWIDAIKDTNLVMPIPDEDEVSMSSDSDSN